MSEPKERIGVVGAGLMGAEIAFVHALAGYEVLLNDRGEEVLEAAVARLISVARNPEFHNCIRATGQPRASEFFEQRVRSRGISDHVVFRLI